MVESLAGKFESVKVTESGTIYDKHGKRVVVDILEFADGSTHEGAYFKGTGAEPGAVSVAARVIATLLVSVKKLFHS